MAKIVIDPGHGGSGTVGGSNANNATGPAGTLEKEMTLTLGLQVTGLLANLGHQVRMTRSGDTNLGLADRAAVAKDLQADVFVSIHLNGFHDPTVQGTETLVSPDASDRSKALANRIQKRVLQVTGYRDRGVKPQELGVLQPDRHDPRTAACLVEVSFLTNAEDEKRLEEEAYQVRIATAIAEAIDEFLR
ncbi:MAG: N-acetylmuramoyl-L-alanine amidase [Pirellulaceae bacterium]|nr:N-acetylmuramoyl-L-alanine amidase [Pirellulaceae bacterium]